MFLLHIAHCLGDLTQRIGSVDDRCQLPCFEDLLQDVHDVFLARDRKARLRQLAYEPRERDEFEKARQAPENGAGPISEMIGADEDVNPCREEHTLAGCER